MPWAGGNYTKGNSATGGWSGDASLGIGIEAGRHDTQDNDFATGIDSCLAKNGSNSCTGDLNLGGFKPVNVAAGTAAAPSYCAGNDVNTGMYSGGADTIAWATNGAEKMRLTSAGRLGVGVTSPSTPLHVEGSITAGSSTVVGNYGVTIATGGASTTKLTKYSTGTGEIRHQGGGFQVVVEDAANFVVSTNGSNRLLVDSAGQVEVGDGTAAAPAVSFISDPDTGIYRSAANQVSIATAGAERVRVDGLGRVGIGGNSANHGLSVEGVTNANASIQSTRYNNDNQPVELSLRKSRSGTVGTNTTLNNLDSIGTYSFYGADGTNYTRAAAVVALVDGTISAGVVPGRLQFQTADSAGVLTTRANIDSAGQFTTGDGSATVPAFSFVSDTNTGVYRISADTLGVSTGGSEQVRVASNGIVGINDTTSSSYRLRVRTSASGITGAARLATDYSGDVGNPVLLIEKYDSTNTTSQILVRFNIGTGSSPAGSGQIVANGANAAAFASYSDESLKENIVPLGDELANIMALSPCEFDYKDGSGHQVGFIAQDVQEVYPDLVSADGNGLLMLAGLSKNEARMIKAIQQLAAKVEALEAQLEANAVV